MIWGPWRSYRRAPRHTWLQDPLYATTSLFLKHIPLDWPYVKGTMWMHCWNGKVRLAKGVSTWHETESNTVPTVSPKSVRTHDRRKLRVENTEHNLESRFHQMCITNAYEPCMATFPAHAGSRSMSCSDAFVMYAFISGLNVTHTSRWLARDSKIIRDAEICTLPFNETRGNPGSSLRGNTEQESCINICIIFDLNQPHLKHSIADRVQFFRYLEMVAGMRKLPRIAHGSVTYSLKHRGTTSKLLWTFDNDVYRKMYKYKFLDLLKRRTLILKAFFLELVRYKSLVIRKKGLFLYFRRLTPEFYPPCREAGI